MGICFTSMFSYCGGGMATRPPCALSVVEMVVIDFLILDVDQELLHSEAFKASIGFSPTESDERPQLMF